MQPPLLDRTAALFLDFDGTLVEIAETPDGIRVPPELRDSLQKVSAHLGGALAVVSGRMISDIDKYLALPALPVSGSHGVERRTAAGEILTAEPGLENVAKAIDSELQSVADSLDGVELEAKSYSPTLHFRQNPSQEGACMAAMRQAVEKYPGWEITAGKMVVEARRASISKATAVSAYMAESPFSGRLPVFIGDDKTDEDGMKSAISHGGFGIKVGAGESVASYRLASPEEVLDFLLQSCP